MKERLEWKAGERIDDRGGFRHAQLHQAKLFKITVKTVRFGIDGDLRMRVQRRQKIRECIRRINKRNGAHCARVGLRSRPAAAETGACDIFSLPNPEAETANDTRDTAQSLKPESSNSAFELVARSACNSTSVASIAGSAASWRRNTFIFSNSCG